MKKEQLKVFVARAASKVKAADEIGTKTTWSTSDHLACVAECLAAADIPPGAEPADVYAAVLAETYNVSAFAQLLAKKFEGSGHFARAKKGPQSVDEFDALLREQLGE